MVKPNDNPAAVSLRFFTPCEVLRPYLTTIYRLTTIAPIADPVADLLHPEWANVRFVTGDPAIAAIGGEPRRTMPRAIMAGPSSRATYFACGTMRAWGVGLLPTGWQRFVATPADAYADRLINLVEVTALRPLARIAEAIGDDTDSEEVTLTRIEGQLLALLADAPREDPLVWRAHAALVDDSVASVAEWGARIGVSPRTLERISTRAFGFAPKLLLRRQRFLRSLARFMLNPQMQWTHTIDHRYCDQPQFVRDFARFMGMGAREYAALPHPILEAAARARMAHAGAAMQGLHAPVAPSRSA
ncbi:helix-turn-helix domain-containing protein [Sphingorhabdus soli]|uniref:Helix-turn-helix domain-containing protein n=1 Tax=Flavisphingopyxis soli TaxID=2601267 RepID=A0A5C6UQQ4_9SPHN|nr:helix-turn-helix domain-containing protein [Sphingorhabdus soli]